MNRLTFYSRKKLKLVAPFCRDFKGPSQDLRQVLLTKSPLKMTEKVCYFT